MTHDNNLEPGGRLPDQPPAAEERLPEDVRIRRLKLYRAALNGDWDVAKCIYDNREENFATAISKRGDTTLHIAATAKRIEFVKELVKKMTDEDLGQQNELGNTALFLAATSGVVKLAKELMHNNIQIAMVRDNSQTLPIVIAAALGHKDMVEHLYRETRHLLTEDDRKELFITSIEADLYDVALKLLADYQDLATARAHAGDNEIGVTALHVLARKHWFFYKLTNKSEGGIFKRCFNLCTNSVDQKPQALQLVEGILKKVTLLTDREISDLISMPRKLLFDAVERGSVEFLSILIREYPDLIWKVQGERNKYTIFHIAVKNRQEDIFHLIYEIGSSKELLLMFEDEDGNNILHLAGKLAPLDRLNIVSGAALQMQRELLWFKKVEKVVQRKTAEARNREELTPGDLFTKEHEDLRKKGEKWLKQTATSCMVVATLITTVVFTAAFRVLDAISRQNVSFQIFVISDSTSLVFASLSIVNFLSILSSRYAEEDFLWLLPRKLRFGLVTLFISIAAMMVVFSVTYFIAFKDTKLWIAILVTAIASTPVILFIWQHLQLFCDILSLNSDALLHKGKVNLFHKEGEATVQRGMAKKFKAHIKIQCTCSTNV